MTSDYPVLSFGDWLRYQRRKLRLTQTKLGDLIKYSGETIRKIEGDAEYTPSEKLVEKLADIFQVPVDRRSALIRFARQQDLSREEAEWFLVPGVGATSQEPFQHDNLPNQLTQLVGRDEEVAEVVQILGRADVRLLTLTGFPGAGKTRLAIRVASEVRNHFTDGVFFINLAPITDADLVISAIAQTINVQTAGDEPVMASVQAWLRQRHVLLLLDNFEQVVAAGSQLSQLLNACQRLKVLVTSRVPLHIYGELEFEVPPLAFPEVLDTERNKPDFVSHLQQYAAVKLFVQHAQRVKPNFNLTTKNATTVAQIVKRLDGLPLAIELAASRVKTLTPLEILTRLDDRFKLLPRVPPGGPSHHPSLYDAIAWSYDLLSDTDQRLFRRLGVFLGGRTLEAIEAVCNADRDLEGDVLNGIESLVDNSLLGRTEEPASEARFVMPETIHEYARARLEESGEAPSLRLRHATFFMVLAEEAQVQLARSDQKAWLKRLEQEHNNIRAALAWCGTTEGNIEVGLRLAAALWRYYILRGHLSEGRRWLESALVRSSDAAQVWRAKALYALGILVRRQGDLERARDLYEESLAISRELNDTQSIADVLNNLGLIAQAQGEYTKAQALYEESLRLKQGLDNPEGIAATLNNLGLQALHNNDMLTARSLLEQSLRLARQLGDPSRIAASLNNLGLIAQKQGDWPTACSFHKQSLAISQGLDKKGGIASSLSNLAVVAKAQGDLLESLALLKESLALKRDVGDKRGIALSFERLADVAVAMGQAKRAAQLLGSAQELRTTISVPVPAYERDNHAQTLEAVQTQLSEDEFATAWGEGQAMTLEQAIEYALA